MLISIISLYTLLHILSFPVRIGQFLFKLWSRFWRWRKATSTVVRYASVARTCRQTHFILFFARRSSLHICYSFTYFFFPTTSCFPFLLSKV
ncbi:hypothetical protein HOY80DRAFT_949212 [Tuber brumale]|nr:hypothetical protein HOY80DRAFT_949212 [Tuber brumale]